MLFRDSDWFGLEPSLQARIEAGVNRIAKLRQLVGSEAKVRQMPPITVVAAAWSRDEVHIVHGLSGPWRDPDAPGGFTIGVLLGAGPALSEDEETVRAVLVHEFAHCFALAKVVVDHGDLGTSLDVLKGDSMNEERERQLLVAPEYWFGPTDVKLMRWGDERLESLTEEVERLVTARELPGEQPPIHEPATFVVPAEWKEHIRTMRQPGKPNE